MATLEAKKTAVLFAVTDKTLVWNGNGGSYNAEYCEECGIPIYPLYTEGGTIVSTPGDLNIGICLPRTVELNAKYILEGFAKIFRKYTYKFVEVVGNDVLVGGVKVLGSSVYEKEGQLMLITPVSMSEKEQLICEISLKHSTKQPGHIDFMTSTQLRLEIEEWLQIHYI
jgi:hypothetical protein